MALRRASKSWQEGSNDTVFPTAIMLPDFLVAIRPPTSARHSLFRSPPCFLFVHVSASYFAGVSHRSTECPDMHPRTLSIKEKTNENRLTNSMRSCLYASSRASCFLCAFGLCASPLRADTGGARVVKYSTGRHRPRPRQGSLFNADCLAQKTRKFSISPPATKTSGSSTGRTTSATSIRPKREFAPI